MDVYTDIGGYKYANINVAIASISFTHQNIRI